MLRYGLIGTPHTFHYENALDALNAGKHVLCEKATTSNATELKALLKLAKEKKLFFMEALWTRFHPLTLELKRIAEEGTLGDPVVLHADLSADFHTESKGASPSRSLICLSQITCRFTLDPSHPGPATGWRSSAGPVS